MVLSVLVNAWRDEFRRLGQFFDALDVLDGLGLWSWHKMVSFAFVEAEVERPEERLPPRVVGILLPRCRLAREGLRSVQAGFFRRLGQFLADGGITVPTKKGGEETVSLDTAATHYLRVVRNSSHSFREAAANPRELSLLAAHTGDLSPELADLAFVHLVRLVADPRVLARWAVIASHRQPLADSMTGARRRLARRPLVPRRRGRRPSRWQHRAP